MVVLGDGRDTRTIGLKFQVIPYRSVYNCILRRPFAEILDAIASPIHLKLKYHNMYDDPVTLNADLFGAKRIYQDLSQDKKDGEFKAMDINVVSLIGHLKDMAIQPSTRITRQSGLTNRNG